MKTLFIVTAMIGIWGLVASAHAVDLSVPQDEAYILLEQWVDLLAQEEAYNKQHPFLSHSYTILKAPRSLQRFSGLTGQMIRALISKPRLGVLVGESVFVEAKYFHEAQSRLNALEKTYLEQRITGFCHFDKLGNVLDSGNNYVVIAGYPWDYREVCSFEGPIILGKWRLATEVEKKDLNRVSGGTNIYFTGNFQASYLMRAQAYENFPRHR